MSTAGIVGVMAGVTSENTRRSHRRKSKPRIA
ncbi:MAG: hypothetical protein DRR11_13275 [Gammaproteobacteria bacterium]|nr:MAG: hypothetical protein DRQ63_01495 [Gammaproteobacteria bacterium]RLA30460.1 MAG: hypothetical protein DRR11_13275 [Gammaproteobacteria bacterium]RLA35742.1 MAG: hypothetical protein DRR15_06690 [Gammaproteobacteria bacterium]